MYVDQPGLARPPHDSVIQRPAKKFRENRNKIKAHRPSFYSLNLTHHHAKQPTTKLGQNLHMAINLSRTPPPPDPRFRTPLACPGAPRIGPTPILYLRP